MGSSGDGRCWWRWLCRTPRGSVAPCTFCTTPLTICRGGVMTTAWENGGGSTTGAFLKRRARAWLPGG